MSNKIPTVRPQPGMTQICPILSVAALGAQSKVMQPGGAPGSHAMACQGRACMLFVPIGHDGQSAGEGACALTLIPVGLNQLQALIAPLLPQSPSAPAPTSEAPHA